MEYTPEEAREIYKRAFGQLWEIAYLISRDRGPDAQIMWVGQARTEEYEKAKKLLDYATYTKNYTMS